MTHSLFAFHNLDAYRHAESVVGKGARLVAHGERCDRHAPFPTVDGASGLPQIP